MDANAWNLTLKTQSSRGFPNQTTNQRASRPNFKLNQSNSYLSFPRTKGSPHPHSHPAIQRREEDPHASSKIPAILERKWRKSKRCCQVEQPSQSHADTRGANGRRKHNDSARSGRYQATGALAPADLRAGTYTFYIALFIFEKPGIASSCCQVDQLDTTEQTACLHPRMLACVSICFVIMYKQT